MKKSISNMNWTEGNRELETAEELSPLEKIAVRISLAYELQSPKQDVANRLIGNNLEAAAIHQLIEFVTSDPAHVTKADPRTPSQVEMDTLAAEWQDTIESVRPY